MKKLIVLSLVIMMLFAFVACDGEAGGKTNGGGGNGEMTPAEQAIMNKYGENTFYFAELASLAGSYEDIIKDICGAASKDARDAAVALYSGFGLEISNASETGVKIRFTDEDNNIYVLEFSNVAFVPSKVAPTRMTFDVSVKIMSEESISATMKLEIDFELGIVKIVSGTYNRTEEYAQGSEKVDKANQCLQEIEALDENGNGGNNGGQGGQQGQGGAQGDGGQGQGQGGQGQGQGEEWTMGTASLPAHTAREIALAMEGMDFYVLIEEPQGMAGVSEGGVSYFYEYGIIHDAKSGNDVQLWAKRWDEMPAQYGQESQYDMIAMDRTPEHQIPDLYEPEKMSDYIYYESDYTDNWVGPDTALYHDDSGSKDWHDAVIFWVYDGEDIFAEEYAQDTANANYAGGIFYHYSDLVKPYTPLLLAQYNGKYEKLSQKAVVADLQCTVYRYANELYYIADSADFHNICLKHTWLVQGKEYVMFEVKELHTFPKWPVSVEE